MLPRNARRRMVPSLIVTYASWFITNCPPRDSNRPSPHHRTPETHSGAPLSSSAATAEIQIRVRPEAG